MSLAAIIEWANIHAPLLSVIGAFGALIMGLVNHSAQRELKVSVDGRLQELLSRTAAEQFGRGIQHEREQATEAKAADKIAEAAAGALLLDQAAARDKDGH